MKIRKIDSFNLLLDMLYVIYIFKLRSYIYLKYVAKQKRRNKGYVRIKIIFKENGELASDSRSLT